MNSLRLIRITEMICTRIPVGALVVIFFTVSSGTSYAQLNLTGNGNTTINSALPGGQPNDAQNETSRLRIRRQAGVITKVTVATYCPGQKFSLRALATGNEDGVPAPEVILVHNAPAVNFLVNIPAGSAQFRTRIRYTASATYNQGTGIDPHTVTYTLVAQ